MKRERLSDAQMAQVDALVLDTMRAMPGVLQRQKIANQVRSKMRLIDFLPHRDTEQHVARALQRLRAAGHIYTVGGGNAQWRCKS